MEWVLLFFPYTNQSGNFLEMIAYAIGIIINLKAMRHQQIKSILGAIWKYTYEQNSYFIKE